MDIAVVGCGNVAAAYLADLGRVPSLSLAAVADRRRERADAVAADHDCRAYESVEALLGDCAAPLVVNLTPHGAHAGVTRACLAADRHVYTEKPLATDATTARDLLELAADRDRRLGCAPINHLCETQRLARRLLRDGSLGTVRVVTATCNLGRVPAWHENPGSFLDAGPLLDGAVYPLTLLTTWFGPVTSVRTAASDRVGPDDLDGGPTAPEHVTATLALSGGPRVDLTASMYVSHRRREFVSVECHGDDGSLYLADAGDRGGDPDPGRVQFGRVGSPYGPVPLQAPPETTPYLAGPGELAAAIEADRPSRVDPRRGAHLVAVADAIARASESGGPVAVEDCGFAPPEPARADEPWSAGGDDRSWPGPASGPRSSDRRVTPGEERGPGAVSLPPVGVDGSRCRGGADTGPEAGMEAALDAGCRLFDAVGSEHAEKRLGASLAARGSPDRAAVVIASTLADAGLAPERVRAACDRALDRLAVGTLDCCLLRVPDAGDRHGPHDPTPEPAPTDDADGRAATDPPLEAAWAAMEDLVDNGLVRHPGIAGGGVGVETLSALCRSAAAVPAVVRVEHHPYRPREDLIAACRERGVRVLGHSPLSVPGLLEEPTITAVADAHGTTPTRVVLRWAVERGVVPVPATAGPERTVEALDVFGIALSEGERARIDALAREVDR